MLDFRYETFLTLCKLKSYTRTAEQMYISQPAVTQHIQYLEKIYGVRLFTYKNKQLQLTPAGTQLRGYVQEMKQNAMQIARHMQAAGTPAPGQTTLRIGATKSIGEYVMPGILRNYLASRPLTDIDMYVDNTKVLLKMLEQCEIDFALLEGFFDKSAYTYRLLKSEAFICVCAPGCGLDAGVFSLEELLSRRIIVREEGSGTRAIIERILAQYSLSLRSFKNESQVSNFTAIKELVKSGAGITFLYRPVAARELAEGTLRQVRIRNFHVMREFNFVMPKGSMFQPEFLSFYDFCVAGMAENALY